jgi:hypothetical protein
VVAVLGLAAMLSACGGGGTKGNSGTTSSDTSKIKTVIKVTDANPKDWCTTTYVTPKFIASVGGEQKCLKTFVPGKNLTINSITVHGNGAVAKATDNSGAGTAYLIKQGGAWKIDRAKSG